MGESGSRSEPLNYAGAAKNVKGGFKKVEQVANTLDARREARRQVTGERVPSDLAAEKFSVRDQKTGKKATFTVIGRAKNSGGVDVEHTAYIERHPDE